MADPHVVVVGGGFGGLAAGRALAGQPVRVTLLDRRNHHLFQPLLYQVATAALNASDIAAPLRSVLRRARNVTVLLAEVHRVDLTARRLVLDRGEIGYDALILAAGAGHSYFGHDDWEVFAPGLKSLEDALEIRRRVLLAYESAERETDGDEQRALLTFVVVGGGPTGVELAGALAEISRQTIARDFRVIDPTKARIVLLEGGPRVLASFPESLSRRAQHALERIGVEVRTGAIVTRVTADAVWLGGEQIRARTVLWAAGVAGAPLARTLGVTLDRSGRVPVEADLSIPGHPEAFAIGDMSLCRGPSGTPLPGLAPVAIQQGRHAADNVLQRLSGRPDLSLPRSRKHGDDRARGGRRGGRRNSAVGAGGVARVAARPHHVPDRLPQPLSRSLRVGVGVRVLAARRAPDHWPMAGPQLNSRPVVWDESPVAPIRSRFARCHKLLSPHQ